jgi:hypothetical protein
MNQRGLAHLIGHAALQLCDFQTLGVNWLVMLERLTVRTSCVSHHLLPIALVRSLSSYTHVIMACGH